jgi:hypothetical protein
MVRPKIRWNRATCIALIALIAVCGALTCLTWASWGEPTPDSGRGMYVPTVLSEGKVLYRDVWYSYGPAAPYFNSVLFRLFGVHLNVLYSAGALAALGSAIVLYLVGMRLDSAAIGFSVGSIVLVQAFASWLFSFPLPYSYASVYGCLTACIFLWLFIEASSSAERRWIIGAGTLSGSNPLEPGWNQVLAYYTDYIGHHWRMGVPTIWAFISMVKLNFLLLVSSPGSVVVGPVGKWAAAFTSVLSVPIVLGITRQRKYPKWTPILFVLVLYSALLLIWPFPQSERFLLPFLPLLIAGLWLEMRRLGSILLANFIGHPALSQRVAAGGVAAVLLSLFIFIGWNYLVRDPRTLQLAGKSQQDALKEREQAYDWIRKNTSPGIRVAAYSDAAMFLYTGRQGLRPVVFLPAAGYMSDNDSLERDLAHTTDAARHVGARYWLTTTDDFDLEVGKDRIDTRMADIMSKLPVVFSSRENNVQIHDASCLVERQRPECQAAEAILFPAQFD